MRKLFIHRPHKSESSLEGFLTPKTDYKIWVPWANRYVYFHPENASKMNSSGKPENYWDQGCKSAHGDFLHPDYVESLYGLISRYNAAKLRIKQLECEYNAWLTGRYLLDSEVKSNCNITMADITDKDAKIDRNSKFRRLRCIRVNDKAVLEEGHTPSSKWWDYYSEEKSEALERRIAELEQDILYEKEQAANLKTERERFGITQRHLFDLYPEAQGVVEELAPQSSVAEEMKDEFGEFEDTDGDGMNDNTDPTPKEMRAWYWLAGGVVVLGLVSLIATKTIK